MDGFCGGYWGVSGRAEIEHEDPQWRHPVDLSSCFEAIILNALPTIFLFLAVPLRVWLLHRAKHVRREANRIFLAKQMLQWVIMLELVGELADAIWFGESRDFVLSPILMATGVALAIFLLHYEHGKGAVAPGVLFVYWLIFSIVAGIQMRTLILDFKHGLATWGHIWLIVVRFALTVISLILSGVPEPANYASLISEENPCPERFATFLSLISFWWMNPTMRLGYRRPLEEDDLWNLNPEDRVEHVSRHFSYQWKKQLATGVVSLSKPLIRAFGGTFFVAALFKLVQDLLGFVSPQLLKYLIKFVEDPDTPEWQGYALAIGLFVAAQLQSFFLHQYFHRVMKVGMRLRSALIAAVYEKSLRLTSTAKQTTTTGEIVNLMSVDAQRFMDLMTYLNMFWSGPLQMALSLYFLWDIVGIATLAGLGVMILMIPINGYIAKLSRALQVKQMNQKDERIKIMNEVLSGLKVIKLYAWETPYRKFVEKIRERELALLRKAAYLNAASNFTWTCAPFLVSLATFATYTWTGGELTASKAFTALALFNLLRFPLAMIPMLITAMVQAQVSVNRLLRFLTLDEMDTSAASRVEESSMTTPVAVVDGNFAWQSNAEPFLRDINFSVAPGSLTAVVGPVGCGKSSLVMALLGEMEKLSGKVIIPKSIAFVPQQAWVRNATLRDNILFGKPYDARRYRRVLEACALLPDLEILPGGDMTEIGEKGINLSGGQKQRVSLARAVYQDAELYILDDPLSAVDSHVGKHIFENVLGPSGLLKNKMRVLVTHLIQYLPKADEIISMKDGNIAECGTYDNLLQANGAFAKFIAEFQNANLKEEEEQEELLETQSSEKDAPSTPKPDASETTKLITKEVSETGNVKASVYMTYFRSIGLITCIFIALFYFLTYALQVGSNFWLTHWTSHTQERIKDHKKGTDHLEYYLGIYAALGFGNAIATLFSALLLAIGSIRSSQMLHDSMLQRVLRAPMSFFDTTPLGRIVNRFAKDINQVDETIPRDVRSFLSTFLQVVSIVVVIAISTPFFMTAVLPMGLLYYFIQKYYVATSRQLQRIESVLRSPIYAHFSETLNGVVSIRAYARQSEFVDENAERVDKDLRAYFPNICANRWLALRLEFIGNCIILFAGLFAVIERNSIKSGVVGLSLSYAMSVTQTLNWMVRMSSQLETDIVAVERVDEYTLLDQEAPAITSRRPPRDWPQEGAIEMQELAVRYRPGLDLVLRGISCSIRGGEKIGVVGRTGAGKSSLMVAIFRIMEAASGKILIDGEDISRLGLSDLRKGLTIMPQDPVLFSGTVRDNLDPFQLYSDEQIWAALETCYLKTHIEKVGLDSAVAEGGENFSVGQRQLMCLARAVLRKTKVLILDEATAAVDFETDELIQQTIRRVFKDCTILTIAHRLNTIMDSDRVMVLDQGRIVEFDAPNSLLQDSNGIFFGMAKDAGIV